MVDAKYFEHEEPVIFDKGRTWPNPKVMKTMEKVMGGPIKIVATVRPIAECIASFYLVDKSDLPIKQWMKVSQLFSHLMTAYKALQMGYTEHPENFCLIEYDN